MGFTCNAMKYVYALTAGAHVPSRCLWVCNWRTRSISEITAALSSSLQFANSYLAPDSFRYCPTSPPIQPLLPKIKNTC